MAKWRQTSDSDKDAREIRAELARLRAVEFRAECARKAERHARAMRPTVIVARRSMVPAMLLGALIGLLVACLFII